MNQPAYDPRDLLAEGGVGVLATIKSSGLPQLSPVTPFYDRDAGTIYVSMAEGRAKTANLRRDARASLHVTRDDFYAYAVVEGMATLLPVATDPHDATADALVEYYRQVAGEHDDWEEYRQAMVDDGRLIIELPIERIYGMA